MSRFRKDRKSYDVIVNVEHEDSVGAKRVLIVGGAQGELIFGTNSATAQKVGKQATVRVTNTDSNVQFIAFGGVSLAAPTISTGFALTPGSTETFGSGSNEFVRTSSNLVQVVLLS